MKMNSRIRTPQTVIEIPTYTLEPFLINGEYVFNIRLTATEIPLIPSVNRGIKVINLSWGY